MTFQALVLSEYVTKRRVVVIAADVEPTGCCGSQTAPSLYPKSAPLFPLAL